MEVLTFILGVAVGGLIGVLFARKNKKIADKLAEEVRDLKAKVETKF